MRSGRKEEVRQAVKSDKLKLIVESGGAAAVLLGLVFVGLELRQNTEAVEAATFQSLTDASSNYLLTIASDAKRFFAVESWHFERR